CLHSFYFTFRARYRCQRVHRYCARNGNKLVRSRSMIRAAPARPALVVVGTGMAGARFVKEVRQRAPGEFSIRMFRGEPHGTYNRILLSSVLGGFSDPHKLWLNPLGWYEDRGIQVHSGVKAEVIDRQRRVVVGGGGKVEEPYDLLVLATGSRPFVPPME